MEKPGLFGKYGYAWITTAFFLVSIALHWLFGWLDHMHEAEQHGAAPDAMQFLIEVGRETFENWQSEFLQLLWQVVGLAYFLYVGSPSSKENDDRMEAKIDEIIRLQAGERARTIIEDIDDRYLRKHGHADPIGAEDTREP